MSRFVTKESESKVKYDSGMQRGVDNNKTRFDLLLPLGIAYEDQMLTRFADLMTRGAVIYGDRNWEKALSDEELNRFKESALRHMMQWFCGANDEDHAAAIMFNVVGYETTKLKRFNKKIGESEMLLLKTESKNNE